MYAVRKYTMEQTWRAMDHYHPRIINVDNVWVITSSEIHNKEGLKKFSCMALY